MKNRYVLAVAVTAILLAGTSASAQRMRPTAFPAPPASVEAMLPGPLDFGPCMMVLQLTEDQKAQFRTTIDAELPTIRSIATLIRTDRDALNTAVAGGNVCNVGTAYLKVLDDDKAMANEMKVLHDKLTALLTADQKSKLETCISVLQNLGPRP